MNSFAETYKLNNGNYIDLLSAMAKLSGLFSDSNIPYINYRVVENIFCMCFNANNLSRSDTAFDAEINSIGIGLKTFICDKSYSNEKVAEFNSLSNEINKYRQGVLEDEFFLQEVGHCKIIKFTDKSNNDFTEVFYNDSGEKLYAETYSEDKLKFLIKYQNDKIKDGIEFDKDGNVIFEYFYNEAEEISKKIEYEYHNNGKRIKEEVNY
jgi:hypothetical protein